MKPARLHQTTIPLSSALFNLIRKLSILSILLVAVSVSAQAQTFASVDVPPGQGRPFILSNRSGTYFYGSTDEKSWDSGWMGLWVHRKRELVKFVVVDSAGDTLSLNRARCRVTPFDVTWTWDKPRVRDVTIFFPKLRCDSLYYISSSGLRVAGGPWFQPSARDSEFTRSMTTWLLSSDSRDTLPADYLETKIRSEQSDVHFSCADNDYAQAVAWAHLQLLFLLAEDDSLLYAGIPWFNEGWGRDTFISLPGLLVTGHADVARKLLMRFAGWVDRDPNSPTYGRIPNRVRPGEEIAYNTADGTPWWILGCYDYGLYARDYEFWRPLLSDSGAITVALEGALAKCDTLGFLTHGDADTWMDAVGEKGPWTPRGNRAVEMQVLHHASLDAALRMAAAVPNAVPEARLKRWTEAKRKLERNFFREFLEPAQDSFCDHLNADGSPDTLFRPNQLYAATVPLTPLIPPAVQTRMVERVSNELIERYGVLSLSPKSPLFHPFHQDEHYPKDAAYHNGTVWVFLSGPAKTALVKEGRADLALQLAEYEANLALTRGCVGSLPELLDAMPRKGEKEPALSGTVSQAWSLAEFLRTTYQDILGIRPVRVKGKVEPFWLFDPRIPEEWGQTTARVTLESTQVLVTMQNHGDSMTVDLLPEADPVTPIGIKAFDEHDGITGYLGKADTVHLVYRVKEGVAYADGAPAAKFKVKGWPYDKGNPKIKLAPPIKAQKFATLAPQPWDVLTEREVFPQNRGRPIHSEIAADPDSDEVALPNRRWNEPLGGMYDYPLDEHFKPGILDLTGCEIIEYKKYYTFHLTFRNLVQPGWHPEYGFQLTFVAIAAHTWDGKQWSGKRKEVGANSNFVLGYPASRLIYVGGGLRIEDDEGNIVATFTPRANSPALGDTITKVVSFSLPKKYFPKEMSKVGWTILTGAQDDHGGAGMGEFRTVKPVAEQWAGGGNTHNGSNVYDVTTMPVGKFPSKAWP